MTAERRRPHVAEALLRAQEATRAAEALLAAGLHRDAVSRAYYALYHTVRALLLARGLESRTHSGSFQLLHREFLKPGLLTRVPGWQIAGLQRSREMADYDSAAVFSAAEVRSMLTLVGDFAAEAAGLLRRDGVLDP